MSVLDFLGNAGEGLALVELKKSEGSAKRRLISIKYMYLPLYINLKNLCYYHEVILTGRKVL
jgi:hypothetical protein